MGQIRIDVELKIISSLRFIVAMKYLEFQRGARDLLGIALERHSCK